MEFLLSLLIGLAISYVVYLLTPKPHNDSPPPTAQDLESPTAEAGRTIPVIFAGDLTIKGLNVLWFGEKSKVTYEVPV